MIFKLKCKTCGCILFYDSEAPKEKYNQCAECGNSVNLNIETRLDNIADLNDFELVDIEKLYEEKHEEKVVREDISQLQRIFDESSEERQERLSLIIDNIYLMLNRNSTATDEAILKALNELFFSTMDSPIEF